MPDFSVLLPVYHGDHGPHVEQAIISVTEAQELRPSELVIVQDGPLGDDVAAVLVRLDNLTSVPVRRVVIESNRGLAHALEAGLAACSHEIVARADADDISLPNRFSLQIPLVAGGLDILGSAVSEFEAEGGPVTATRVLPLEPDEIRRMARFRDPFNHPSVVYRRTAVARAGGYQHLNKMEDYWLFVRMLHTGAKAANLPDALVLYRVGAGAFSRRGGWEMLTSEAGLQWRMWRARYLPLPVALRNLAIRGGYRFVPTSVRRKMYHRLISESSESVACSKSIEPGGRSTGGS